MVSDLEQGGGIVCRQRVEFSGYDGVNDNDLMEF